MEMGKLVEVIKEGEIVKMSESQAREEDLFILRNIIEPDSHIYEEAKPEVIHAPSSKSMLQDWRNARVSYKNNNVLKELKENFQWEISKVRRGRNMTRKQLSEAIRATEEEIKMIELGELPSDDFVLISKIENVLGIDLRKEKKPEGVSLSDLQKMSEDKVKEEIERVHKKDLPNSDISGSEIEIDE